MGSCITTIVEIHLDCILHMLT